MPTTAKALFRGAASTNVATSLYTVPAATTAIITNIVVTNTSGSAATFTLNLGGVNFATTVTVAAVDGTNIDLRQVLTAGQTITGGASTALINFHISGVEIT